MWCEWLNRHVDWIGTLAVGFVGGALLILLQPLLLHFGRKLVPKGAPPPARLTDPILEALRQAPQGSKEADDAAKELFAVFLLGVVGYSISEWVGGYGEGAALAGGMILVESLACVYLLHGPLASFVIGLAASFLVLGIATAGLRGQIVGLLIKHMAKSGGSIPPSS